MLATHAQQRHRNRHHMQSVANGEGLKLLSQTYKKNIKEHILNLKCFLKVKFWYLKVITYS